MPPPCGHRCMREVVHRQRFGSQSLPRKATNNPERLSNYLPPNLPPEPPRPVRTDPARPSRDVRLYTARSNEHFAFLAARHAHARLHRCRFALRFLERQRARAIDAPPPPPPPPPHNTREKLTPPPPPQPRHPPPPPHARPRPLGPKTLVSRPIGNYERAPSKAPCASPGPGTANRAAQGALAIARSREGAILRVRVLPAKRTREISLERRGPRGPPLENRRRLAPFLCTCEPSASAK